MRGGSAATKEGILFRLLIGFAGIAACLAAQTPVAQPLKDLAVISGRVVASGGQPLRKATVMLRPMSNPGGRGAVAGTIGGGNQPQPYGTTTDAAGNFSFDGVDPGVYMLVADHPGYISTAYNPKKVSNGGTMLTLTGGQNMSDLTIELPAECVITGKAIDEDGEPEPGLMIRVLRRTYIQGGRRQYLPMGQAVSDDQGEYKVSNLQPGRYIISISPQRGGMMETMRHAGPRTAQVEESAVTTYYPGSTDLASATTIDLTPGQHTAGINVRLKKAPVFHIRGKVSGAASPETAVRVTVSRRDNAMAMLMDRGAAVVRDGSFDIGGVTPGSYLVTAMLMARGQMLDSAPVEVGSENIENLSLQLKPMLTISGVLKIEGDQPAASPPPSQPAQTPNAQTVSLSQFRVSLVAVDTLPINTPNTAAKPDGAFSLTDVSPVRYRVNVFGGMNAGYVKSIKSGGVDVLQNGLDLTNGDSGALEIVVSLQGGGITGSVKDADGQPVSASNITLIPEIGPSRLDLYKLTSVGENGQFTLKGLAPGKYMAYAWETLEPNAQFDPDFMKLHERRGVPVTVSDGAMQPLELKQITAADLAADGR